MSSELLVPIRRSILSSVPEESAQFGKELFDRRFLYAPLRHAQALDPNTMLVEGTRGAGKSLWWAALLSKEHRKIVARTLPKAGLDPEMDVRAGFGTGTQTKDAPSKDIIRGLLGDFEPREIWRAVVGWQILSDRQVIEGANWRERVTWIQRNTEEFEAALDLADDDLQRIGKTRLMVFDALDTAADTWADLRRLLRGLLQVTLEFRSRRRIRLKIFVRPDMLQDSEVISFPDASKVLNSKAQLIWTRADLYGLLWQMMANASAGAEVFRGVAASVSRVDWCEVEGTWAVPLALRHDEDIQRHVFHALTGPWMGPNPKRGLPYTWLPNHLADAFGQASPRSFQVALRTAAEHESPLAWPYPLHHEGIRRGVQEASRIRVREIVEDYAWISPAMEPLRGKLTIPCWPSELRSLWEAQDVLRDVRYASSETSKLGPQRIERGADGLIRDLEDLGLFQRLPDDRLQMPDVYRVAFGLGRKGGVKPLR